MLELGESRLDRLGQLSLKFLMPLKRFVQLADIDGRLGQGDALQQHQIASDDESR